MMAEKDVLNQKYIIGNGYISRSTFNEYLNAKALKYYKEALEKREKSNA